MNDKELTLRQRTRLVSIYRDQQMVFLGTAEECMKYFDGSYDALMATGSIVSNKKKRYYDVEGYSCHRGVGEKIPRKWKKYCKASMRGVNHFYGK